MMTPIRGTVSEIEGKEVFVLTTQGRFILALKGRCVVQRRTVKRAQNQLKTNREVHYSPYIDTKPPSLSIGDEITILTKAPGKARANGDHIAIEWAFSRDADSTLKWVEEGQQKFVANLILFSTLYEELVRSVPGLVPGEKLRRSPYFVYVPPAAELTKLGLSPGYFFSLLSDKDLDRFEPLSARRVDFTNQYFVVQGTYQGAVELVSASENQVAPTRVFGILHEVSSDILVWNPGNYEWEKVLPAKVNVKARDRGVKIIALMRPKKQLVLSRFGVKPYHSVPIDWVIVGANSQKYISQNLSKMPTLEKRV